MKNLYLFLILFLCFTLYLNNTFAQENIYFNEKVHFFADRSLYISGEKIQFSTSINTANLPMSDNGSKIVYVELITPSGKKIIQEKFKIENTTAKGILQIPENTISGYYYLRCYTKFMRNFSNKSYNYTLIKIINPYDTRILTEENGNTSDAVYTHSDSLNCNNEIKISLNKLYYNTTDTVNFKLFIDGRRNRNLKNVTLTFIPDSTFFAGNLNFLEKPDTNFLFFAENKGLTITGKVQGDTTKSLNNFANINLSFLNDKDFTAVKTTRNGAFRFLLPDFKTQKELFFNINYQNNVNSEIYIDNDFCSQKINLPSPAFSLTNTERERIIQFTQKQQIEKYYKLNTNKQIITDQPNAFYSEISYSIPLEKYVDLPSLEEYFNEISGYVRVRKNDGKKIFKIYGTDPELNIYPPLVLIDMVVIDDAEKILAVSPQKISRIEIITKPYIKGELIYGGIISIFSKKGDFGGIDLPKSGTFINYSLLSENQNIKFEYTPSENIPDYRNTIYWNPDIMLKDQATDFNIPAPYIPGNYTIIVRAVNEENEELVNRIKFTVTDSKLIK